ncbi:hypothetical protein ACTXKL_10420 [Brachybacterium tyrofermentans]
MTSELIAASASPASLATLISPILLATSAPQPAAPQPRSPAAPQPRSPD